MKHALIIAPLLLAALLAACDRTSEEPGVVARVNDDPIYLYQLERKYDLQHMHAPGAPSPSVEHLKEEFGLLLSELIVQKLVEQELARHELSVTPEELAAAEEEVREDYPDAAAFEQILIEEYVDVNFWREQLRARLAAQKLLDMVLRPQISIDYAEVEDYYRDNITDFYVPARVEFIFIDGPDKGLVEKATQMYQDAGSVKDVAGKLKGVEIRRLKMREDRMPPAWRAVLDGLETGRAGPMLNEEAGFQRLILLSRSEAKILDPSKTYPLVEKVLVEGKLQDAFDAWLAKRLESADISVSEHLLEQADIPAPTTQAPTPAPLDQGPEPEALPGEEAETVLEPETEIIPEAPVQTDPGD
jgi:hypothetical protein